MPFYIKQGNIPDKRHTQFRDKKGNLYWEELVSRQGFSSIYSNVYHINFPTAVKEIGNLKKIELNCWLSEHRHHHLKTNKLSSQGDSIKSRIPLFYNSDIILSKAHVNKSMTYYYKNSCSDELIFIQSGKGILKSNFGKLNLIEGDYIVIPKGIIWQIEISKPMKQLIIETTGPIEYPSKYKNKQGQLLEHSPYSERDIRTPKLTNPKVKGSTSIIIKTKYGIQKYKYKNHPCDIIGWDGFYFPWILNINDFMPITGKIHQPPPVHQTFQAPGTVICSFVPRLFDYHPKSIPAPYAHSNVDSDEILYYIKGNFMSRKEVEEGSITFHPAGLPHGPQPGKIEESLNLNNTTEMAIMIDTFKPLNKTIFAKKIDDNTYPYSWI